MRHFSLFNPKADLFAWLFGRCHQLADGFHNRLDIGVMFRDTLLKFIQLVGKFVVAY
jgi:hypothetical protein